MKDLEGITVVALEQAVCACLLPSCRPDRVYASMPRCFENTGMSLWTARPNGPVAMQAEAFWDN